MRAPTGRKRPGYTRGHAMSCGQRPSIHKRGWRCPPDGFWWLRCAHQKVIGARRVGLKPPSRGDDQHRIPGHPGRGCGGCCKSLFLEKGGTFRGLSRWQSRHLREARPRSPGERGGGRMTPMSSAGQNPPALGGRALARFRVKLQEPTDKLQKKLKFQSGARAVIGRRPAPTPLPEYRARVLRKSRVERCGLATPNGLGF